MSIESAARALIAAISPDSTGLAEHVQALREALDASDGYTVCIQEVGVGSGTTHVTFQQGDRNTAVRAAIRECRSDWGWPDDGSDEDDDLHVLAVMRGDVEIIEWSDQ